MASDSSGTKGNHTGKRRLDLILVEKDFFTSREKSRAAIMAGYVTVNGIVEDKPGNIFDPGSSIEVIKDPNPYVGRGGLKLEKALGCFKINLNDITALDIGASTGGFTDCMLKHGASKVAAVDVGYGQLAWVLRNDPRVIVMERTNARYLKPEDFDMRFDFATIDCSFISLSKILPTVHNLVKKEGSVVCLIKPQFEAGRSSVGKKGVVRDASVHESVIVNVVLAAIECGFIFLNVTFSPIRGPEGNIEYLIYLGMPEFLPKPGFEMSGPYLVSITSVIVTEARIFFKV